MARADVMHAPASRRADAASDLEQPTETPQTWPAATMTGAPDTGTRPAVVHTTAPRVDPVANPKARVSTPATSARPMATTQTRQRRDTFAPVAEDASPAVVHVTIGTVEVRAPAPPPALRPAVARAAQERPRQSPLQDYLQRRSGGRQP